MDIEVICTQCKTSKPLSEFSPRKNRKIGHASECKECAAKQKRDYRAIHPEKVRQQARESTRRHAVQHRDAVKRWRRENREKRNAADRKRAKVNREKERIRNRIYRLTHPEWAHNRRRRYNKQYPEKTKAHDAVKRAVQAGKLPSVKTLICAHCHIRRADNYHHYKGYDKRHWLDVKPLCYFCHSKADRAQEIP